MPDLSYKLPYWTSNSTIIFGSVTNGSIPNIKGTFILGNISGANYPTAITNADGAFYGSIEGNVATGIMQHISGYNQQLNIDASRSSSIYSNNAVSVLPAGIKMYLVIKY